MAGKAKKFRVCTEGDTTDGRQIQRDWLSQIAKNYDPKTKLGARVNLEHLRGILPDGPFRAYGDVLSVEVKEVEDGKLALFAEINPTDDLVAMTKARQKIYTSCEIDPNFAGTGEAYLVGLAVTDSPASLGTEMLQFSAQAGDKSPLASRKQSPANLFSAAIETKMEFESADAEVAAAGFLSKITELLSGLKKPDPAPAPAPAPKAAETQSSELVALTTATQEIAKSQSELIARVTKLSEALQTEQTAHAATAKQLTELVAKLSKEPDGKGGRTPATGGTGEIVTDC